MVDTDAGEARESRPPTLDDLLHLCRALNAAGARYVVIGGMAVIHHGFVRATEAIDLLVDASPDNQARIRQALLTLPEQAVREVRDTDLEIYEVVRVADEFVVDLMKKACGIDFQTASDRIEWTTIEGVMIPFASPVLLQDLKQAPRAKDELDRAFLRQLLDDAGQI